MKKKVVVADSGISAPQMMDFWRKVGDGTINGEIFQSFLANPRRFSENNGVTLARVISIMGDGKVITAKQSAKAMGMETPKDASIRYNEQTIRQCAEENRKGQDWRLIYCFGLSLRALREKFGTDNVKQPCFDKDCTWWLGYKEDVWATKNPLAGYYLINVRGQFGEVDWDNQEQEIVKISNVERCHEAIFAEAILIIFKVSGERIAENWCHWGSQTTIRGGHVNVGYFDFDGLSSFYDWRDDDDRNLRVSLARKFDH